MSQAHRDALSRPLLASRIQRDGHRRSRAEGRKKEVIRRRPGVRSASHNWLVSLETVPTSLNLLREPECATAHYHITLTSRCHFTLAQHRFTHILPPWSNSNPRSVQRLYLTLQEKEATRAVKLGSSQSIECYGCRERRQR